jgi:AraC family transcriptional regulator of adaptative response / DNA-3-methyladenine glycosylase II
MLMMPVDDGFFRLEGELLDLQTCEQARLSRDARFDGLFFIGVKSTGVYCRPICPARTCNPESVVYYPSAAAASAAGLRPCLRCRPEAAPGTPAWNGTSASVARALNLIREGALNGGSVEALGERLGIGGRHLRRLFQEHLGASPTQIAMTQRVLFAKQLLRETDRPITDIAFAAAFGSIRRFNAAFLKWCGRAPSSFRRAEVTVKSDSAIFDCRLRLPFRQPYNWPAMLDFFRRRAIAGIESVEETTYRRTVRLGAMHGAFSVDLAPDGSALTLEVRLNDGSGLLRFVERVRRLFDLDTDLAVIYRTLARDKVLAQIMAHFHGLRLPGIWEPFEAAVRAMIGQQRSVAAARTVLGRIVAHAGPRLEIETWPGLTHFFPAPAELRIDETAPWGLTERRAMHLCNFSRAVAEGEVRLEIGDSLERFVDNLTAFPGIGHWTAHYAAMRGLGEPDAFPAGDLGIAKALAADGRRSKPAEMLRRAESWRPWRAYAAMYL